MIIKLIIKQAGDCAQVFAYADEGEAPFNWLDKSLHQIKIWHNARYPAISETMTDAVICRSNHIVIFRSKVPFNTFCQQFDHSEYNNPQKYHYLWHNCSDAALFALLLAKIPIKKNTLSQRLLPDSIARIPAYISTPIELYESARQYKLQIMRSAPPFHSNRFRMELVSKAFSFQNPGRQGYFKRISNSLFERLEEAPHQFELCMVAMRLTVELLTTNQVAPESLALYDTLADSFKKHHTSKHMQEIARCLDHLTYFTMAFLVYFTQEISVLSVALAFCILLWRVLLTAYNLDKMQAFEPAPSIDSDLSITMHEMANQLRVA